MDKNSRNSPEARIPLWLKRKLLKVNTCRSIDRVIKDAAVSTICAEAKCPNSRECFSSGKAAFLILGNVCTRRCTFCAIRAGNPFPPDRLEPEKIAETISLLKLDYAVITSVTRDDLPDGGAGHFVSTVHAIRSLKPGVIIELLIPDFGGNDQSLTTVLNSAPDVLNHNLETVPRLYRSIRPGADYLRSLELLKYSASNYVNIRTKSGIMLGLGEKDHEVEALLCDLHNTGCRTLTIGQYLQPSFNHTPVIRYVTPEEFDSWRARALDIGFESVSSGPFVRSSYNADLLYHSINTDSDELSLQQDDTAT